MRRIVVLPSFERGVKKLTHQAQRQLAKSLERFNEFFQSGQFPQGFGFKKINHDKYEFRVDIRLRVVLKEEDDVFYLVLVGDHDDVKRYLRDFR